MKVRKTGLRMSFWTSALVGGLLLAAVLAWVDRQGDFWLGWFTYSAVLLAGLVGFGLSWNWVARRDAPRWLLGLCLAAFILRALVGVGLFFGLPAFGYQEETQQAGYLYYDAFRRDTIAWELARSDRPLLDFSPREARADQYSSLLVFSASLYRYLSFGIHRPLLMALVAAMMSMMAVLFCWAFSAMTFGFRVARGSSLIMAFYPEFVLLGATQMREPFIVAGFALALVGYGFLRMGKTRSGLVGILVGGALSLMISPPFGVLILGAVAVGWFWEERRTSRRSWMILAGVALLGLTGLILTLQAWSAVSGFEGSAFTVLRAYIRENIDFQLRNLESGSGVVQALFQVSPDWAHLPMATIYGILQPFLPAALIVPGAWIWRVIGVIRSLGWYLMLPGLLFSTLAVFRVKPVRSLIGYFGLLTWATILLASVYAGGDQWDNPRYRAVFTLLAANLLAWGWVQARDFDWWSLMVRSYALVWIPAFIFTLWYAGRYTGLPNIPLSWTVFSAVAVDALVLILPWISRRSASQRT